MFLTKLKIKLPFKKQKDKLHFVVLSIVLLALSYKYYYLSILLILYLLYLFINDKKLTVYCLSILLIIVLVFILKEVNYHKEKNLNDLGTITDITKKETNYRLKIKSKGVYYLVSTKEEFDIGDIVRFKGSLEKQEIHYPHGFDYEEYLHFQNIKGVLKVTELKKVGKSITLSFVHYQISDYLDRTFDEKERTYLKTLVIGSSDSLDTKDIKEIGISHLFVVSGLHVNIIVMILMKILSFLKIKDNKQNIFIIIFCLFYVVITNFLISVIRVFLSLFLKIIYKDKLTSLDIISLNICLVSIVNPYYLFNISFILTYMISFFMIVYQDLFCFKNKIINKVVNLFTLTFLIQLYTLPVVVSMSPSFNLISIICNPLFIYFVTYLFLPLSFITIFISPFSYLYSYLIIIFEYLTSFWANIEFLKISLGDINILFKIVYLLLFYLIIKMIYQKKYHYLGIMVVVFIIWYYKGIFNLNDRIYFLDLEKGEATLVVEKNNQHVILIDTGEVSNQNSLTKILIDLGIRKIDYLIISHSDSDHIGGSYDLVEKIKVKNLVLSKYDVNQQTNYLKKKIGRVKYLKDQDFLKTRYFSLNVLSPSFDYGNANDNSLVFVLEVFNIEILFTGDISKKIEEKIINKYPHIDVDFLKVPHHGSKTSSSDKLVNKVKYDYAVIMSGYYNTFGFPMNEVVERYDRKKILLTSELNTIIVEKGKKNYKLINLKK